MREQMRKVAKIVCWPFVIVAVVVSEAISKAKTIFAVIQIKFIHLIASIRICGVNCNFDYKHLKCFRP